jgi:hypothetical protein
MANRKFRRSLGYRIGIDNSTPACYPIHIFLDAIVIEAQKIVNYTLQSSKSDRNR